MSGQGYLEVIRITRSGQVKSHCGFCPANLLPSDRAPRSIRRYLVASGQRFQNPCGCDFGSCLGTFRQVACRVTPIKFYVYKEAPYYVAQCINVDVSSFGDSIEDAIANLKEAVTLYLEEPSGKVAYRQTDELVIGEALVGA